MYPGSFILHFLRAEWLGGISHFVNTLGAVLAPAYRVMIADYYFVKHQQLDVQQLFSSDPEGAYYYNRGWNQRALLVFVVSGGISMFGVWLPALQFLSGFSWLLGAMLAGVLYCLVMPSAQAAALRRQA